MGGSNGGGGGFDPFIPRNNAEGNACLNLSFTTYLASVDATVLTTISVGACYDVVAETDKGPVIVLVDGRRLGTVLHMRDVQLLTCIFEGTEYLAKILAIEEGKCQVIISAKR